MESKWLKAKKALKLSLCTHIPDVMDDASPFDEISDFSSTSMIGSDVISTSENRSYKKTCAICLGSMKPGHGHALFTAECSHTFHFNCITSNVKHGNYICPICRAKWKEIPFQANDHLNSKTRVNPLISLINNDPVMNILRHNSRAYYSNRPINNARPFHIQRPEPSVFNDDEPLSLNILPAATIALASSIVEINMFPEFSAVDKSTSVENFTILIHIKAPISTNSQVSRAPIDLVTVLDVSGSMAGTKLALLKQAMGFLIQNLGSSDRLSVITFSSYAHRLFHLRRMSDSGRQLALQEVNSLTCQGGTNIPEGLKKGSKVLEERKEKNLVCGIILLSDGKDTNPTAPDYSQMTHSIPVHSFGFGEDHDADSMHAISEISGGTFSYIETESVIQDAFAQCIGGLLTVVVQDMEVMIDSMHSGVHISSIKSGSYASSISSNSASGKIRVGDLYADEERNFLVQVNIPQTSETMMPLLQVSYSYLDVISNQMILLKSKEVSIHRPISNADGVGSIVVDRERNRILAAEAMADAKFAAERGAFDEAGSILGNRCRLLCESEAWKSGDELCISLEAELKEVQDRMVDQHQYDVSGRAYVLSGMSSHARQRATTRGETTSYQTPSMVEMLQRSQTFNERPRGNVSKPMRAAASFNFRG